MCAAPTERTHAIVMIGKVKDEYGFLGTLMEHTGTGERYIAYEPQTWFERAQHLQVLASLGKPDRYVSNGRKWSLVHPQGDAD